MNNWEGNPGLDKIGYTQKEPVLVEPTKKIPEKYGDTRIVILPRDPVWFFTYWEVNEDTLRTICDKYQILPNSVRYILRVYDVTDLVFDGSNAHSYFDIEVGIALSWYVNTGKPNRSFCVDLGTYLADGQYISFVRSNVINMPRQGISTVATEEQWALLHTEFERILKLSGIDQIGRSSFDLAKMMIERWREIIAITSFPHIPSSWQPVSSGIRPQILSEEKVNLSEDKNFWLKADTELIVYGATERDAKLTVSGQEIPLMSDGTFSLRFSLPDGIKEVQIRAHSPHKNLNKEISFVVTRETK